MSLLEQSRAIAHVQGIPPGAPSQLLSPHPLDSSAPNPDVLLALLTRNKALEGMLFERLLSLRSVINTVNEGNNRPAFI